MNNEEHRIQRDFVTLFRGRWSQYRPLMFAIPNGGARDVRTGAMLKAEGVLKGVWDLMLCVPVWRLDDTGRSVVQYGMIIEVKRPAMRGRARGGLTVDQEAWGAAMSKYWERLIGYTTQELLDGVANYLGE